MEREIWLLTNPFCPLKNRAENLNMLNWNCKRFNELMASELYAILQLRAEVFIMEQKSIYQDLDGKDQYSMHLMAWDGTALAAYCRIIAPEICYAEPSIGRVITPLIYRGTGVGKELMGRAIGICKEIHTGQPVRIKAQAYLKHFYSSFGFEVVGEIFMEDGIEHVEMLMS